MSDEEMEGELGRRPAGKDGCFCLEGARLLIGGPKVRALADALFVLLMSEVWMTRLRGTLFF